MAYGKAGDWYINSVEGGGGSSDFSTANVTFKFPSASDGRGVDLIGIIEFEGIDLISNFVYVPNTVNNITAVLYKGMLHSLLDANVYSVESGSATIEHGYITITGDCVIVGPQ